MIEVALVLIAAALAFVVRGHEFRRSQRSTIYGDVVGAFMDAAHAGAGVLSAHMTFGDEMFREHQEIARPIWDAWVAASNTFETSAARLRLIGSSGARAACGELEAYINANVRAAPPFTRYDPDKGATAWGEAARVGPAEVDRRVRPVADAFLDAVRPELASWRR